MRKSILFGLSPALLFLVATSCQKQTITKTSATSSEVNQNQTKNQNNLRVWHDNGAQPGVDGVDYGCWSSGGNCLPDVVITASMAQLATSFGTSSNPAVFASTNYSALSKIIDRTLLDGVINGELLVSIRGKITTTEVGYLTFRLNTTGDIRSVSPFKK